MSAVTAAPLTHWPPPGRDRTSPPAPQLENGDRLTRSEFMRRWQATPQVKRAELIEGIVFMAAAVRIREHGEPHGWLGNLLSTYAFRTKGLIYGDNSTVGLDPDNAPQPDSCLILPRELGSAARVNEEGYLEGPPDLVGEVAASSVSIDLHKKLQVYRRNGVREYLVWRVGDNAVDWFVLAEDTYRPLSLEDGLLKSTIFPGLWLDPQALVNRDFLRLCAALDLGMATADYRAFQQQVAAAQAPPQK